MRSESLPQMGGHAALAALVAVITFINRISRGKRWSVIEQDADQLLIGCR